MLPKCVNGFHETKKHLGPLLERFALAAKSIALNRFQLGLLKFAMHNLSRRVGGAWRGLLFGNLFFNCRSFATRFVVFDRRADEAGEERLRRGGLRFKFRMILHGEKPWMSGQFHHLDERIVGARSGETQAMRSELISIAIIEFVTVTMSLGYFCLAVASCGKAARLQLRRLRAEPHRAALVRNCLLRVQQADHRVR